VLGLIVAATAVCGWRWGPYLWHQAKLLYWQRQCMNFSAPADTVVYEEDPAAAAVLLKTPGYSPYVLKRGAGRNAPTTPVQAAAFDPQCLINLAAFRPLQFGPFVAAPGGVGGCNAILFLHERISPAGHHRLVYVSYAPSTVDFQPEFIAGYNYETSAVSPATWTTPLSFAQRFYAIDVLSGYPPTPPLVRVYAGQPDPTDPAHFTVRYQIWGQEDTLDGRLQDDDQITLTPRQSPQWPTN